MEDSDILGVARGGVGVLVVSGVSIDRKLWGRGRLHDFSHHRLEDVPCAIDMFRSDQRGSRESVDEWMAGIANKVG